MTVKQSSPHCLLRLCHIHGKRRMEVGVVHWVAIAQGSSPFQNQVSFLVCWNHMKQRTKLWRSPRSLLPSFLISYGRTTPSCLEWQSWSLFLCFILWFSSSCYQSLKRITTTKQNKNTRRWSGFPKVVHSRERNRESTQEQAAVVGERMGYKKVRIRSV